MTSDPATLRVLLVEDEALIAMLLADMLVDLGHQVAATAGRLDHAMKLASELPIDFAILDVNLNGEQTFPLAADLKARRVPFVFSRATAPRGCWRNVEGRAHFAEAFPIARACGRDLAREGGGRPRKRKYGLKRSTSFQAPSGRIRAQRRRGAFEDAAAAGSITKIGTTGWSRLGAVRRGVFLRGLVTMMHGLGSVSAGDMTMVAGFFVAAALTVLGRLAVMARGLFMMVGGVRMVH